MIEKEQSTQYSLADYFQKYGVKGGASMIEKEYESAIAATSYFEVAFGIGRTLVVSGRSPLRVAYSDDENWIEVNTELDDYVYSSQALFVLDNKHVWLGTAKGRILFSNDGGESWIVQHDGILINTPIVFFSHHENTLIASTEQGMIQSLNNGETWNYIQAPEGW